MSKKKKSHKHMQQPQQQPVRPATPENQSFKDWFVELCKKVWSAIKNAAVVAWNAVKKAAVVAWNAVKKAAVATGKFFAGLAAKVKGLFVKEKSEEEIKQELEAVQKRFPGVTSFRELSVLAKNSAAGADEAFRTYQLLSEEVSQIEDQIARFRNPVDAGEDLRAELSEKRAKLRDERDTKARTLALAKSKGLALETAADEYAYIVYRLKHERVNYRKTERFAEPDVNVSNEEIKALASLLSGKEKFQARVNVVTTGKIPTAIGNFFRNSYKKLWFMISVVVLAIGIACAIIIPISVHNARVKKAAEIARIQAEEAEAARLAEEARLAAEKAKAEEEARLAAEEAARLQAEAERLAEEARLAAEESERARLAEEARKAAEAAAKAKFISERTFSESFDCYGSSLVFKSVPGQATISYPSTLKQELLKDSFLSVVANHDSALTEVDYEFGNDNTLVLTYPEEYGPNEYPLFKQILSEMIGTYTDSRNAEIAERTFDIDYPLYGKNVKVSSVPGKVTVSYPETISKLGLSTADTVTKAINDNKNAFNGIKIDVQKTGAVATFSEELGRAKYDELSKILLDSFTSYVDGEVAFVEERTFDLSYDLLGKSVKVSSVPGKVAVSYPEAVSRINVSTSDALKKVISDNKKALNGISIDVQKTGAVATFSEELGRAKYDELSKILLDSFTSYVDGEVAFVEERTFDLSYDLFGKSVKVSSVPGKVTVSYPEAVSKINVSTSDALKKVISDNKKALNGISIDVQKTGAVATFSKELGRAKYDELSKILLDSFTSYVDGEVAFVDARTFNDEYTLYGKTVSTSSIPGKTTISYPAVVSKIDVSTADAFKKIVSDNKKALNGINIDVQKTSAVATYPTENTRAKYEEIANLLINAFTTYVDKENFVSERTFSYDMDFFGKACSVSAVPGKATLTYPETISANSVSTADSLKSIIDIYKDAFKDFNFSVGKTKTTVTYPEEYDFNKVTEVTALLNDKLVNYVDNKNFIDDRTFNKSYDFFGEKVETVSIPGKTTITYPAKTDKFNVADALSAVIKEDAALLKDINIDVKTSRAVATYPEEFGPEKYEQIAAILLSDVTSYLNGEISDIRTFNNNYSVIDSSVSAISVPGQTTYNYPAKVSFVSTSEAINSAVENVAALSDVKLVVTDTKAVATYPTVFDREKVEAFSEELFDYVTDYVQFRIDRKFSETFADRGYKLNFNGQACTMTVEYPIMLSSDEVCDALASTLKPFETKLGDVYFTVDGKKSVINISYPEEFSVAEFEFVKSIFSENVLPYLTELAEVTKDNDITPIPVSIEQAKADEAAAAAAAAAERARLAALAKVKKTTHDNLISFNFGEYLLKKSSIAGVSTGFNYEHVFGGKFGVGAEGVLSYYWEDAETEFRYKFVGEFTNYLPLSDSVRLRFTMGAGANCDVHPKSTEWRFFGNAKAGIVYDINDHWSLGASIVADVFIDEFVLQPVVLSATYRF